MRLPEQTDCHLSYCTNIHPGESWPEVWQNLNQYLPNIKSTLSPNQSFGVGLRLSAKAGTTLQEPSEIRQLSDFLDAEDLYVFTINGFPYGKFHGEPIKTRVYQPDWQTRQRLDYTNQLANILATLLPKNTNLYGSISTVPGTYRPYVDSNNIITGMVHNLVSHVAYLVKLFDQIGHRIVLALEPEPACFLESISDIVTFFDNYIYTRKAAVLLNKITGLSQGAALDALHKHLGICYDTCHTAIEYEDPLTSIEKL